MRAEVRKVAVSVLLIVTIGGTGRHGSFADGTKNAKLECQNRKEIQGGAKTRALKARLGPATNSIRATALINMLAPNGNLLFPFSPYET